MKKHKGIILRAIPREEFMDALIKGYLLRRKPPMHLKRKFIKKSEILRRKSNGEVR